VSRGIRADFDDRSSTISYKIREAEYEKIPYMAVCGPREEESNTISIRQHGRQELGVFSLKEFMKLIAG
jgi:threonyl-tRNA synthetase